MGTSMVIQDPLTGLIIGCCYRVANELGNGFLEKVYKRVLARELWKAKVKMVQQQGIDVFGSVRNFVCGRVSSAGQ